jgi:hypothetical protein
VGRNTCLKKLITPSDRQWFVLFLCSRWGKSLAEIHAMPVSEFDQHWNFWKTYKWGMTDDLLAITAANELRFRTSKSKVRPYDVKEWTLQKDYAYRVAAVVAKPVSAIRSGFEAMLRMMGSRKWP